MPEAPLIIRGVRGNKFRVEPTEISADGGPEYPRLVFPLKFDVKPIELPKHGRGENVEHGFTILAVGCDLFMENRKIADAMSFINRKVRYSDSIHHNVEVPLDLYRIGKIEERRKGDVEFRLDFSFLIAIHESLEVKIGSRVEEVKFLSDLETVREQIILKIPQSHWVEKILPSLGYGKVKLIEIPMESELIPEEFSKSLEEFTHAQEFFNTGDYDKAVAHCRSALEVFKDKMPELKKSIKSKSEREWVDEIASGTYDWLDRIHKKTSHLASKTHHVPSTGHFSRRDAEVIMLITTALLAYLGRLSGTDGAKI